MTGFRMCLASGERMAAATCPFLEHRRASDPAGLSEYRAGTIATDTHAKLVR